MWETTCAPVESQNLLRKTCKHLLVPTKDSAQAFKHPRAHVVPLGASVVPLPLPNWIPFTFLYIGNNNVQLNRKKPDVIAEAFKLAFPTEADVRLILKQSDMCSPIVNFDTRIAVIQEVLPPEKMEELYEKAHVVVNISGLEGWSYPLHDAIAHGRPVMTPLFGAVQAFCTKHNTWPVPYREAIAPMAIYQQAGKYAHVRVEGLSATMRTAYQERHATLLKAAEALKMATNFNIQTTQARLYEVLCQIGICSRARGPHKASLIINEAS
jgi:glycosyltransferase involved in cell wall biosynthesis